MTFNKHYFCSMQINKKTDEYFMQKALQEAQIAFDLDEVPVGAVITCEDQIIARTHNYMEHLNDACLLYTSPSPRDLSTSRMPSSA